MSPLRLFSAAMVCGAIVTAAMAPSPAAAKEKTPPTCAAISFRPVPPGMSDGTHDAGLYKSRFGKIEIKAEVKNGMAENYFMEINGKRPAPLASGIPKAAEPCLTSKHVRVPVVKQDKSCTGERFRVAIHNDGGRKLVMLFGLHGREWQLCEASMVQ
ncbi:MAG: hypothetical protein H7840_04705 [Alphaproteobacteria bacterium]